MRRLFVQFIVRRLVGEPARSLTTIVGVAAGIAMVVAIQLTNASSVRGFETALDTVSGRTSIEISSPGGIDETLLPALGWLREFGPMSPVIEGEMALVAPGRSGRGRPRRSEALKVLGIDILRDRAMRDYVVASLAAPSGSGDASRGPGPGGRGSEAGSTRRPGDDGAPGDHDVTVQTAGAPLTSQQFLAILTSPQSVVITEKLARRRGYAVGDEIRLMTGDRLGTYVVRALLEDSGPARVMDGSFVLMDIAAAQLAFERLGRLDRIDVQLSRTATALDASQTPTGAEIDAAVAAIGARLPGGLTAGRPARRGQQVERMLAAFHLNLSALSWVALVVGLFLVYNTATIAVLARREEIGMLRALGVTRRQVLGLFLAEAALVGLLGTMLGIGLARLLADWAIGLTGATVSTLYIATAAAPPALSVAHVWLALGIGIPLSLLAAALPAFEASRVPPTAAIRGSDRLEMRVRLSVRAIAAPLLVLAAAIGLAQLGPVNGRPLFGYASGVVIIVGASLLVPVLLFAMARLVRRPLRRLLGAEGLLAHAHLASAIPRLSISVAALSVSLAMLVAVAVMIGSFRDTVVYWVGQTINADLFVGPGVQPTVGSAQTLSPEVVNAVRTHPGVEAVDSFRNMDLVYRGNLVVLGAGHFDVVRSHGRLLFKTPADGRAALARAIGADAVVVSEAFAYRYAAAPGATLQLPTPAGDKPFRVEGIYYDYAVDRGVIAMDRGTFVKHFGDLPPTSLAVYLRDGAEADEVRREIIDGLEDGRRAFIYSNRALRAEVLRIFDSTFAITYALELIAIAVAMLGVAGTLLTLVLERRRELGMLRLIGAARRQVQRIVVVEAALIGAASMLIGLAVGLALSLVLVFVINVQSFGWTIQFRVPWIFLAQVSVVVVVATALAGLLPARQATRLVVEHEE